MGGGETDWVLGEGCSNGTWIGWGCLKQGIKDGTTLTQKRYE